MGAFISGLLGGAADVMQKKRDAEAKKKDEFAKGLQGIITNPDASPTARQQAWEQWSKIYKGADKESKSGLQQIGGLLQHVFGKPQSKQQGQPQEQGQNGPQGQPNTGASQVMPPPGQSPQAQQAPQDPKGAPQGGAAQVMPRPQQAQGSGLGQPGMFQDPNAQKLNLYEAEQKARAQIDQQITQQVQAQKDKAASDYAATLPPDQQKQWMQDYEDKKFLGTPRPKDPPLQGEEIKNIPGSAIAKAPGTKDAFGGPIDPNSAYTKSKDGKYYPEQAPPKAPKEPTEAEKNDQLAEAAYRQGHNIDPKRPLTAKEQLAAKKEMKESQVTDEAREMHGLTMELAKQRLADQLAANSAFTQDDAKYWAGVVLTGASLPPFGYGQTAAKFKGMIVHEAVSQAKAMGLTSTALALQQLVYRAGGKAIGQAEMQRTVVQSFENNVERGMDLLLNISNQKDRTGSPLINKYKLYLDGKIKGDSDTQKLIAQTELVKNEFARVMVTTSGGGMTSDTARKEAERIIGPELNKATIDALIGLNGLLKTDMANRIAGYNKSITEAEARSIQGVGGSVPPSFLPPSVPGETSGQSQTKTKTWNPQARKFEDK